jgi:hypothetical protein
VHGAIFADPGRVKRSFLAIAITGCAGMHGHLVPQSAATSAHADCLDLQIERTTDEEAPERWPIIAYRVGNTCRRPVVLRFDAVRVLADREGTMEELALYDPRHEVRPAVIDAEGYAEQLLAYRSRHHVDRVCVILEGFADGAPDAPICLDAEDE